MIIKEHLQIQIKGIVQGIGLRPFVVRLARRHQQCGWVMNTAAGLTIAVEGLPVHQQYFLADLHAHKPPLAQFAAVKINPQPLAHFADFQIRASGADGDKSAFVLPDIAVCAQCRTDVFNPDSRFYRYPFTSCSQCGPRYSIMRAQPYDRARTSMADFGCCPACWRDYQTADDRRFHAQTIACPTCGPQISLLDAHGEQCAGAEDAIAAAIEQLRAGKIIALKGIGGFQLLVDASHQDAVGRLRQRKRRPYKPFALLVADTDHAHRLCFVNQLEQQALTHYAAPIVLLKRRANVPVADAVAPDSPLLGVMLACSPLHHLLVSDFAAPLVATSGNRQDEPMCTGNGQALTELGDIADYFLVHDRAIVRPLDDSIVRLLGAKITVLRRARGYTPLPLTLNTALPDTLAVGGQLKNTVAISHQRQVIVSQHLGDLSAARTRQQFQATLTDLQQFYQLAPDHIMHDAHDGYASSPSAARLTHTPTTPVQHHYAHCLSCMAEHGLEPPLLGIVWDGTGLGADNTLWGGEFLLINAQGFVRFAHSRPLGLVGGEQAIREPRRAALGVLYELFADGLFNNKEQLPFSAQELQLLRPALAKQLNCPRTTSVGRLFDAVASLLGLCQINHYEGQAAMALENCAADADTVACYGFEITATQPLVMDWQNTIIGLLADRQHMPTPVIAAKFHNTLAAIALAVAERAGQTRVVLSGGCFQNALLVEKTRAKLTAAGFSVYCHEQIPPNDGGLALGQVYARKFLLPSG
jgi:hydrogenase maturation protein HypF